MAALSALLSQGCSESEERPRPAAPSDFFGINGDLVFNLVIEGEMALVDEHLKGIEALGVGFVRSQADWRRVEPARPLVGFDRDFAITDAWVGRLAAHGLRWQVLGNGRPIPRWAADEEDYLACGSSAAPRSATDFASYMAALVHRYGPEGDFWSQHPELPKLPPTVYEVWNEPNHPAFWCPTPDPEAYGELLAETARAIHRVDGSATVLFGGLAAFEAEHASAAADGRTSYRRFLAQALRSPVSSSASVDGVAVHPYGETPEVVADQLDGFRSAIDATALRSAPMYVNETGWYTRGLGGRPATPEATRAEHFRALTDTAWSERASYGIASFAPYSWATREEDGSDPLDWLGLANPDTGAPYPSALAYGEVVRSPGTASGR